MLAIATLKRRGVDCASVIVVGSRRDTLAERMQALEYAIAMRTRRYRPWLTSGACMVLRAGLYREVVARHSNFFLGEDIEVGRIALWCGANCGHVALDVETDVPPTFRGVFRQRRGWWCGSFRLSVVNIDRNLQVPGFFLYSTLFVSLLLPFKLAALVVAPRGRPAPGRRVHGADAPGQLAGAQPLHDPAALLRAPAGAGDAVLRHRALDPPESRERPLRADDDRPVAGP